MKIRVASEICATYPHPTSIVLMLYLHPSVAGRVIGLEELTVEPRVAITEFTDIYGNRCGRIFVPAGQVVLRHHALVFDEGQPDPQVPHVLQHPVRNLPNAVLLYLLPSRYCEVDSELKEIAWSIFGHLPAGWSLVQSICDFVHHHVRFDYQQARPNRTALDVFREKVGVCRDFMHLAITFCRCLNVPARYCTGYLGDIGVPPVPFPMDFCAWFEVFLGETWYAFDARNNTPRIGRILMARGRDAADVALTTSFGVNQLQSFQVWTDEVIEGTN